MKLPLVLSILLISQPTLIFAQETNTDIEEKIEIKQTVDEDLKFVYLSGYSEACQ